MLHQRPACSGSHGDSCNDDLLANFGEERDTDIEHYLVKTFLWVCLLLLSLDGVAFGTILNDQLVVLPCLKTNDILKCNNR